MFAIKINSNKTGSFANYNRTVGDNSMTGGWHSVVKWTGARSLRKTARVILRILSRFMGFWSILHGLFLWTYNWWT